MDDAATLDVMAARTTLDPRPCPVCGRTWAPESSRARYCSGPCRNAARRARERGEPVRANLTPLPSPAAAEGETPGAVPAVTPALVEEFTRAGRMTHPAALAALSLAVRIDAGAESSAGHAALVRELRAARSEALDGAAPEESALARLQRRAAERRGPRPA